MKTRFDGRYVRLIKRLAGARRDAGFTQAQAARTLKWQRSLLSNIENNQRRADILEVYAMAKLYGVKFRVLESILTGKAR